MNKEIKEILDKLQECVDNPINEFYYPEKVDNRVHMNSVACKVLKDYITNLQQENERLKENLEGQENLAMAFSKTSHNYYQRIEKAIRLIEEYHYFVFTKDIETIYKNANKEFINILKGENNE